MTTLLMFNKHHTFDTTSADRWSQLKYTTENAVTDNHQVTIYAIL